MRRNAITCLGLILLMLGGCNNAITPDMTESQNGNMDYGTEIEEKDQEILALENDKAYLEEQLSALENENASLETQLSELETGVEQYIDQIAGLEEQLQNAETPIINIVAPDTPSATLSSAKELEYYLLGNYGVCETSIGPTYFTFDIYENSSTTSPYDYWIQVEYDFSFFYELQYSTTISTEMNHRVCAELKQHQENLARAIIELMPGKKLYGGYHYSWYTYPSIQVDLNVRRYYSWVNYSPTGYSANYNNTNVVDFQWYPLIDDDLTR